MRYIFGEWHNIIRKIDKNSLFIFLDFDGTLSPIVSTPGKAVVPAETKKILGRLAKNKHIKIAVISGRSLKNVKSKLKLHNLIYSGNHGLEIEGPKIKFTSSVSPTYKATIKKIKDVLRRKLSAIQGVLLEDKGMSLGLHYRLVKAKNVPLVKTIFHETTIRHLCRGDIRVKEGKKVLEVSPALKWNKGRVVLWLLARQEFLLGENKVLPIYIGDDTTDEDAFKALKNKGLTIFVGKSRISGASYYLKDTKEVARFLRLVLKLKTDHVRIN